MSTSLALGAVTAVLTDMLAARFAGEPVASALGQVNVSALPPDRIDLSGAADPNQVNVFLHQVTRNAGWANTALPSRDGGGRRTEAPPLVLDLHYLVTVFGATPLASEILLGEAMLAFHEEPVPTRAAIERALSPAAPPTGFPAALAQSGIAEQIERLRIVPSSISAEDVSRLWSAMQARYRTTVPYLVTTVIIDSRSTPRGALPVARRIGAALPASVPLLLQAQADGDAAAPLLPGSTLRLQGQRLAADALQVELAGIDVTALVTATTDDAVSLVLPEPLPAGLYPGPSGARVIHRRPLGDPPVLHAAAESNLLPVLLRPRVSATATITDVELVDGRTLHSGTLALQFTTPVARHQQVQALLNELDAPAGGGAALRLRAPAGNGLPASQADALLIELPLRRVPTGRYLLRAQVDGADSLLVTDAGTGRFSGPVVDI
ncbi:DUF4255 domain-containing protein [Aquincola sp. J276]|uniref:DUF4255 domain-containing protein n=1 Tax=Aquincola sp. J276 TaxID=2898432 RepID=UPI002151757F|nr:DUF4255 domain-containing protein [Aquincola sp. J276]MCR5868333.1 DUF4255 domain-containing protein [Aquincola sp. J276]